MDTTSDTWQPDGQRVLGIWAHPDDETYLSAGLMLRAVRAGGHAACVHATRGEHGTDDPRRWPPHRLAAQRERELAAALAVLGAHQHTVLGHPDGGCADADADTAVRRLAAVMRDTRPDVIVTFGPDGMTGHPDHSTVSRWTTAAWVETGCGRLLYATSTTSFMARNRAMHARLGLPTDEAACIDDERVAVRVCLTPAELDRKRRALAAQPTQTRALAAAMGEKTYRHWYDVETFRTPEPAELRAAATSRVATT